MKKNISVFFVIITSLVCGSKAIAHNIRYPEIVEKLFIDSVWVANRVGFDIKTVGERQFVAYYNAHRMMTVAQRRLGENNWEKIVLPNKLEWDSHNSVSLGVDKGGFIHVSGNMHATPMIYFRSLKPFDVTSLVQVKNMVGEEDENRVTYPSFFSNKENDLFYSYRSGGSGNGNVFVNRFDVSKKKWERCFSEPLFEGVNKLNGETRSAYHSLSIDDEGMFHITWMWRWTPKVETCHQLCYVKSKDLKNWYNITGEKISLPLRPDTKAVVVDDVPSKGGLHNGKYCLILTKDKQPIIGYVKYDENGNTQFYLARTFDEVWQTKKISDWTFRWHFLDGGDKMTIGCNFEFVGFTQKGNLVIDWSNEKQERGTWIVNPQTLELEKGVETYFAKYPLSIFQIENKGLNLQLKSGGMTNNGIRYVLRWEAAKGSHGGSTPQIIPQGPIVPLFLYGLLND